jgi:hypothetical protein
LAIQPTHRYEIYFDPGYTTHWHRTVMTGFRIGHVITYSDGSVRKLPYGGTLSHCWMNRVGAERYLEDHPDLPTENVPWTFGTQSFTPVCDTECDWVCSEHGRHCEVCPHIKEPA